MTPISSAFNDKAANSNIALKKQESIRILSPIAHRLPPENQRLEPRSSIHRVKSLEPKKSSFLEPVPQFSTQLQPLRTVFSGLPVQRIRSVSPSHISQPSFSKLNSSYSPSPYPGRLSPSYSTLPTALPSTPFLAVPPLNSSQSRPNWRPLDSNPSFRTSLRPISPVNMFRPGSALPSGSPPFERMAESTIEPVYSPRPPKHDLPAVAPHAPAPGSVPAGSVLHEGTAKSMSLHSLRNNLLENNPFATRKNEAKENSPSLRVSEQTVR